MVVATGWKICGAAETVSETKRSLPSEAAVVGVSVVTATALWSGASFARPSDENYTLSLNTNNKFLKMLAGNVPGLNNES